jgi:hypothetical protein
MSARIIVGAMALVVVSVAGVWSTVIWASMVDDVNRTRLPAQRFHPMFWTIVNRSELLAAYRASVPMGRKHRRLAAVGLVMCAAFVVLAGCIGLIPRHASE